jgi:hypothetical protein
LISRLGGILCLAAACVPGQTGQPIFNGQNLDGWDVVGDGDWKVISGGVLIAQATSGAKLPFGQWPVTLDEKKYMQWRQTQSWLYTKAEYSEFDLHVEYLTAPGGNSGISIRDSTRGKYAIAPNPDFEKTPAHWGYEVQIYNAVRTKYSTGSIYLFAPAEFGHEKPGDWNSLDIESRNDRIRVRLNGREVSSHPGDPARPKTGPIGLQLHDRFSVMMFRNIRLGEPNK